MLTRVFWVILVLAMAGCRFDRSGLDPSTPASDMAAWESRLSFRDGLIPMKPRDGQAPLPDLSPDHPPPPDQFVPLDLTLVDGQPVVDQAPPCGPSTCRGGCCDKNVCLPGSEGTACGSAGTACSNCTTAGKVCQAGSCVECSTSVQCVGETACFKDPADALTGLCVPAYNRYWRIVVVDAKVNCSTSWDPSNNSGPDPYTNITVGSNGWYTTTKKDTCDPVWKGYLDAFLGKTTKVLFEVFDSDVASSQFIGKVDYPGGLPLTVLKQGKIAYQATDPNDDLLQFNVTLRPVAP